MKQQLLTLREVAQILGLSNQRIYQLDTELDPIVSTRGTKMKTRLYRLETVERYRATMPLPVCACGCGGLLEPHSGAGRPRKWMEGHERAPVTRYESKTYKPRKQVPADVAEYSGVVRALWNVHLNNCVTRKKSNQMSIHEYVAMASMSCVYCGGEPKPRKVGSYRDLVTLHGLDRVDNEGPYSVQNCLPCCARCNWMKSDMQLSDFLSHIRQISEFQNWEVIRIFLRP